MSCCDDTTATTRALERVDVMCDVCGGLFHLDPAQQQNARATLKAVCRRCFNTFLERVRTDLDAFQRAHQAVTGG